MGTSFSVNEIPDLTGKVIIVTGGTSGIGFNTSIELAKKGAHVIATARNAKRMEQALQEMSKQLGETFSKLRIEFGIADQEDLSSIRAFASWFVQKDIPLHVLILNAGIAFVPFKLIEGIESQLFVNHVSHHYLARLLLPKLKASAPSRVVVVASNFWRTISHLDLETPTPQTYSKLNAYANSKLASIYFVKALQKRVAGNNIFVNAVHPGTVSTPITSKWAFPPLVMACINAAFKLMALSPLKGSLTSLFVATSPEIESQGVRGQYFYPIAKIDHRMPDYAEDLDAAERLWEWTDKKIREITAHQFDEYVAGSMLQNSSNTVPKNSTSVPVFGSSLRSEHEERSSGQLSDDKKHV